MDRPYKYGFSTAIETESFPKGLSRETIVELSRIRDEPSWLCEFRLEAYEKWLSMPEPRVPQLQFPPLDYQGIRYYSAPKNHKKLKSLDEVDPEVLRTFQRLGIPLNEHKHLANVALDVVFDSVSIATSFSEQLAALGIVLCSIPEAVVRYEELVRTYLGSVVPPGDNFFAALNAAVFSDGSFVYIPKGTRCPLELSTYFRMNDREAGQFERTLIIADEGSSVSYLEGCTAPAYPSNQLHAAVVEVVAHRSAHVRYSTVQNWYPGSLTDGSGGVYNFVTKRGLCSGDYSTISWTQVEVGAAITWKYPSCILKGDHSRGEFYSVSMTNGMMQADTGTRMIHIGKQTRSVILSKGICADQSSNTYRGQVVIKPSADGARNYTKCDSMLIGHRCAAYTIPKIQSAISHVQVEHEATTSKLSDEQMLYLRSRGHSHEEALQLLLHGFCGTILEHLPLEFAVEARNLLSMKLEQSVG